MEDIDKSNTELYKSQAKDRLKSLRSILVTLIRTMPRNELIEVLKKKKIVRYEYLENKDELVLVEIKQKIVSQPNANLVVEE